jgi:hypothetical protein
MLQSILAPGRNNVMPFLSQVQESFIREKVVEMFEEIVQDAQEQEDGYVLAFIYFLVKHFGLDGQVGLSQKRIASDLKIHEVNMVGVVKKMTQQLFNHPKMIELEDILFPEQTP